MILFVFFKLGLDHQSCPYLNCLLSFFSWLAFVNVVMLTSTTGGEKEINPRQEPGHPPMVDKFHKNVNIEQ